MRRLKSCDGFDHGQPVQDLASIAPAQGPLKALQWNNLYGGSMELRLVHLAGLYRMIALRGGPQACTTASLGLLLCA